MVYVGNFGGLDCYAAEDADDVKVIAGRKVFACDVKGEKRTRTARQNRALHKLFALIATALNAAGWDMIKTLTKQAEIPWTQEAVKNHLWRPLQEAMLDKTSTTELDRAEVSEVYEVLSRHMGQKLGVHVAFPRQQFDNAYDEGYYQVAAND